MTLETNHNAIEVRFHTQWASATPVQYMGTHFVKPANSAYVIFEISEFTARQMTFGATTNLYRSLGYINITIVVPKGDGPSIIRGHIDSVVAIFRGWTGTNVTCKTPVTYNYNNPNTAGMTRLEAGEFDSNLIAVVMVPFRRDEYH